MKLLNTILANILSEDIIYVSIGANDGIFVDPIFNSGLIRNTWSSFLVEPVPSTYEKLKNNYDSLFPDNTFTYINAAVYTEVSTKGYKLVAPIHDDSGGMFSFTRSPVEGQTKEVFVDTITFDTLLKDYGLKAIDLLSVDAENLDFEIVCQCFDRGVKPKVIMLEDNGVKDCGENIRVYYDLENHPSFVDYTVVRDDGEVQYEDANVLLVRNDVMELYKSYLSKLEGICLCSEVNYPNYVKRFLEFNYDGYKKSHLPLPYFISTTDPLQLSNSIDLDKCKVYDSRELGGKFLKNLEFLPTDPTGLYPAKYPWNLRRHIIRQAVKSGYNKICFLEADVKPKNNDGRKFIEFLNSINLTGPTIFTSGAIYDMQPNSQCELYSHHGRICDQLSIFDGINSFSTIDGTDQFFWAHSPEELLPFLDAWDFFATLGYVSKRGYKSGYLSNISLAAAATGIPIVRVSNQYDIQHIVDYRY